ncbi:MAG TPA: hypothetical protein VIP29_04720 [Nitrososphaeraceae archaeon]|nr:hypothetical protein [Nitrososphaeraceae archaeon]
MTAKIELSQSLHDISLSIATRLYQENVLKEQTVEELMLATLRILIKEYEENPESVVTYFLKRR